MSTKKKSITVRPRKKSLTAPKKIYDKDFYEWTNKQASLLQKKDFLSLDLEHLIEEILSLGRSERDKLESHLTILLMHMLKVKYQSEKRTRSWDLSIVNARHRARKVLKENPSLKSKLQNLLKEAYFSARLDAAIETGLDIKVFPKECLWKQAEIL